MRKISKAYLDFLDREGYGETFLQKDVRILFNVKHGTLTDLIVERFEKDECKLLLYKIYDSDIGNCLSDWDDWTFSDVLIKIFVSYQVPAKIRKKILFELSKVEEWRPHLAFWIWRNWSNES